MQLQCEGINFLEKVLQLYNAPHPPAAKKKLLFCLLVRLHAITTFNLQGAFQIGFLALKMFDKCEPVCFFMNVFIVHYGFES